MPRPQNEQSSTTTIGGVPKSLVSQLRLYARRDGKRSGFESNASILERIVGEYSREHSPPNAIPKGTYDQ